ncbi:hypothetical protein [Catenuloplanes japonicus]|uniref:hypothetical protein n=1 Tax=Catenuloplanes japonicus TaxID=33876 RepID=UPI000AB99A0A|nr:hypothetical protein [Catenuloplanes japonicus]
MDEPSWCDPQQCTAHEQDFPPGRAAHRSAPQLIEGTTGRVSLQIVQRASMDGPHLVAGVTATGPGGSSQHLAVHLPISQAPHLEAAIHHLAAAADA